ncbi:hypothetical protein SAMN05428989_2062 [Pseudoxanthomonas sp. GM95]|uniref:hypothetical protein n=1 Tax=Pseudoxanthomonas sp. GM95 TaxID=1881043 RepID=UPI0008AC8F2C|nr:hypothetical protein [Pseudoxanthomonas sp. GM95]SEL61299.1 hypothetical protein SAMN05428989_2062 [Pseudoxanthomonas sp. GM95]
MESIAEARLARRRARADRNWHAAVLMLGGPPIATILAWMLLPPDMVGGAGDVTLIWSIFMGTFVIAGVVALVEVFFGEPLVFWLAFAILSGLLVYSVHDFRARTVAEAATLADQPVDSRSGPGGPRG